MNIDGTPLKISVVAPDLAGGGTTRVYLVANALQQLGHDVTVVGAQFAETLYPAPPENLTVQAVPATRSLQYFQTLNPLLAKLNGDVIYAIKPRPTSFGTALIKKLTSRTPLIVDIDDWEMSWVGRYRPTFKQLARDVLKTGGALRNPEHSMYLEWMEKLITGADAVTATTQFLQHKFGGHYLPNGKDTTIFDPARYKAALSREKYGLADYRVLMFPGTARPHKGLEDVLMAMDQLNESDLRLVIVGGRRPDSYEDGLFERWGQWLIKLPRFPIDEMAEVVSAAHVVVVPQRDHATAKAQFPLKLTDGMSMAKPIISTRVGDIPTILDQSGYLVDPESPAQIAEQIKFIFTHEEEAAYKGQMARDRCIAHYSTARMGEILTGVLRSLSA
ncbi:MAG: glycosyltransferase [Phormidesmis sp.]